MAFTQLQFEQIHVLEITSVGSVEDGLDQGDPGKEEIMGGYCYCWGEARGAHPGAELMGWNKREQREERCGRQSWPNATAPASAQDCAHFHLLQEHRSLEERPCLTRLNLCTTSHTMLHNRTPQTEGLTWQKLILSQFRRLKIRGHGAVACWLFFEASFRGL